MTHPLRASVRFVLVALVLAAGVAHAAAEPVAAHIDGRRSHLLPDGPALQAQPQAPAVPEAPPAVPAPPAQPLPPPPPPAGGPAIAQPPALPDIPIPDPDPDGDNDVRRRNNAPETFRMGEDYVVRAGETRGDTVVIGGNVTVEGRVDGDVVVIAGGARLAATGEVDGDFVVVGGNAVVEEGASVTGDAVVVGGRLEAPPSFRPGGEQVNVGVGSIGEQLQFLGPWLSQGLVWGRLFVPGVRWLWGFVLGCFLFYLLIVVAFDRPVQRCVDTLDARPITAFGTGLLVLLLAGPATFMLLLSVVGIVIVPFAFLALLAASIVGRVTVAKWLGQRVLRSDQPDNRSAGAAAFTLGFSIIVLLYAVPFIGLLMWGLVGVLGLGAVSLAAVNAYREENPRPAPLSSPPPVPPVPPTVMGPGPTPDAPSASAAMADMPTPGAAPPAFPAAGMAPPEPPSAGQTWAPPPPAYAAAAAATGIPAAAVYDLVAFPRGSFGERLGAFVLDAILVFILVAWVNDGPDAVFMPLFCAYRIGAWTWKSATLGQVICQLRVTRADGRPLGFADALVRGLSSIFSIVVLGLGCFWVLRDDERQAWHDKIAGTYVVKVPRNFPL